MFSGLTRSEQRVLFILIALIALGLGIRNCRRPGDESFRLHSEAENTASSPKEDDDAPEGGVKAEAGQSAGLVDVNSAGEAALTALKGVGPVKASAIIEYRSRNGPFRSKEELLKVRGIGPATLSGLSDEITVGNAAGAGRSGSYAPEASASPEPVSETPSPAETPAPTGEYFDGESAVPAIVNINEASKEELMTLWNVGEKRAEQIIKRRRIHGPFRSVKDIIKIKGIGEKTYQKNRLRMSVDKR